jgi:hypothetical protein
VQAHDCPSVQLEMSSESSSATMSTADPRWSESEAGTADARQVGLGDWHAHLLPFDATDREKALGRPAVCCELI